MSYFSEVMVNDYADKIKKRLTKKKNKTTVDEFEIIEQNIDLINKIPNIEKVEPMTHCLDDFEFELREDKVEDSIAIYDLLANCDDATDREVSVPKVVG